MTEIVLVGSISRAGRPILEATLKTPARIREYPCELAETHVLVGSPVTAAMIAESAKLRLVHASGVGMDAIAHDVVPAGVTVCNVSYHERAMAEHVVMVMLALERRLIQQDAALREGKWDGSCVAGRPVYSELRGKKLGIIGFGAIGAEVASLLQPFGLEIDGLRSRHTRGEFERMLAASDHLLIACPLNDRTRGLIGAAEIDLMKPSAFLVNVARGEIVQEKALYEALANGRIRGAAIDVWYRYPTNGQRSLPSSYPFHELDNVILTPHSSGWTEFVLASRFREIASNIDRLVSGAPLTNVLRS